MFLKMLKKMIDVRASFSVAHLVKALLLLSYGPIGRHRLMKELGLKEASIKTLLKNLQKNSFIITSTKGHKLTEKGAGLVKRIKTKISDTMKVEVIGYTIGKYNSAILVKKLSKKVKFGVEQRDEAIKIGATGATTLVQKNGKLIFPRIKKGITELENILRKSFSMDNDDVIIIGSGPTYEKAEEAAIVAALSLL